MSSGCRDVLRISLGRPLEVCAVWVITSFPSECITRYPIYSNTHSFIDKINVAKPRHISVGEPQRQNKRDGIIPSADHKVLIFI